NGLDLAFDVGVLVDQLVVEEQLVARVDGDRRRREGKREEEQRRVHDHLEMDRTTGPEARGHGEGEGNATTESAGRSGSVTFPAFLRVPVPPIPASCSPRRPRLAQNSLRDAPDVRVYSIP